jgi:class 3 adenylate cyclase
MPSECLLINPQDPDLRSKVDSIAKTPGICTFIDITGSTQMKCSGIREWVARIHNCFANATAFMPHTCTPLKSIGDALMYYIEEGDLQRSGYSPLQVFHGLWQLATETGQEFPNVKIAAWCDEAYPITFFPGSRDYYGIDIDMTARLQSLAASREVVIDSRLRDKVVADYQRAGNASDFGSVERLVGPENAPPLKGIARNVVIYRAR